MEFLKQFLVLCMFVVCQMTHGIPIGSQELERAARSTSTCRTPDNLDSLLTSVNEITDGVTYLRSVNWTGTDMFPNELNIDEFSKALTQFTDNTVCTVANTDKDAPIWARSLCPWSYEVQSMPDYYPGHMVQAKCKCQRCVENNVNVCEPVKTNIRVLKKSDACIDGFNIYKETTIEVAVGCACAKPLVTTATTTPPQEATPPNYEYIN
ncbi:uncharacterized protein LOC121369283 [Gigantopelta aegis]|uniref:uncharacterized protein LOC121369283 n=1 Tax=Gigantopelta aegis TaxID=1735272 RepID=UPI001B88D3F2|nr:uncharacterized protein LOC121369283 [Gigantopelta aegis]